MKLDYDFLKQILLTLEDNESYKMSIEKLRTKLNLDKEQFDKLEGHIKLLEDNNYVEFEVIKFQPNVTFMRPSIKKNSRLTSQGYEFLEMLQNDNIFNKIKGFALPIAFEFGKQALMEFLKVKVGLS